MPRPKTGSGGRESRVASRAHPSPRPSPLARRRKSGRVQGGLARVVRVRHGPDDGAPTGYDVAYVLGGKRLDVGRDDLSYTTAVAEGLGDAAGGAMGRGRREKRSAAADDAPGATATALQGGKQGKKSKTTLENEESAPKVATAATSDEEPMAPRGRRCGAPGCCKWSRARCHGLCTACFQDARRRGRDPRESVEPATRNTNACTKVASKSIGAKIMFKHSGGGDIADNTERDNSSEEGTAELWDFKAVLEAAQIRQAKIPCQTPDCDLVACTAWESNLSPDKPWFSCLDCQERDFRGWPEKEELPIDTMGGELRKAIVEKCTRCPNPRMPDMRSPSTGKSWEKKRNHEAAETKKETAKNTSTRATTTVKDNPDAISTTAKDSSVTDHMSRGASATYSRYNQGQDISAALAEKANYCGSENGNRGEAGEGRSELKADHFHQVTRCSARLPTHGLFTHKRCTESGPAPAAIVASPSDTAVTEVHEFRGEEVVDGTTNSNSDVAGYVTAGDANTFTPGKFAERYSFGVGNGKDKEERELAQMVEDAHEKEDEKRGTEDEDSFEGDEESTIGLDQIRRSKQQYQMFGVVREPNLNPEESSFSVFEAHLRK